MSLITKLKVPIEQRIEKAANLIAQADSLIVAAGAGMGIDSGLPDFRGKQGFWRAYPALRRAGIDFAKVATPNAFKSIPMTAWGFYGHRLSMYRQTQPHRGFELLRQWGARMTNGMAVFTSNVDGHFQKAGFDPKLVHECHGSIHQLQCMQPCHAGIWSAVEFNPVVDADSSRLVNELPLCPVCGELARPNILMFNDSRWLDSYEIRQAGAFSEWLALARKPVVIEIGAGTAIQSVRRFSEFILRCHNGRLVRINPQEWKVSDARDVGIPLGALDGILSISSALDRL